MTQEDIRQKLRSPDAKVRLAAVQSLSEQDTALLAQVIDDPSQKVRDLALQKLTRGEPQHSTSILLEHLRSPDSHTRCAAVKALGYLKAQDAVWQLLEALGDPEPKVANAAITSLAQMRSPYAFPGLHATLKNPDPTLRASAATALGQLGDARAVEALKALALDDVPAVRTAAAQSLKAIAPPQAPKRGVDAAGADKSQLLRLALIVFILFGGGVVLGVNLVNSLIPAPPLPPALQVSTTECLPDSSPAASASLSPDGTHALFQQGPCLYLHDVSANGMLSESTVYRVEMFGGSSFSGYEIDWLDANQQIAYLAGSTIKLLDLASSEETTFPIDTPDQITAIDFSPDDRWLAFGGREGSNQGLLTVSDVTNQEAAFNLRPVLAFNESIAVLQWRPDQLEVAISSYSRPLVLVISTSGQKIAEQEPNSIATRMAWSPDGEMLVFSTLDEIIVWSVNTDETQTVIEGTRSSDVTWSPDSSEIAWSTEQGEVFIWGLTERVPRRVINNFNQSPIKRIVWTQDGIVGISSDAIGYFWSSR